MEGISELSALLAFPKQIAIISHRNPDGDALGSSLALSLYLQSVGHSVKVIMPSDYPINFEWMPQSEEIIIFDTNQVLAEKSVKEAEIIFCLDFNSLERIDKLGLIVLSSTAAKIMVDHHLDPEPFADIIFSRESSSSTAEIIYEILIALGAKLPLSKLVIDCLYAGIMTDTGSFHHATSTNVFKICGELKEQGLDDTRIQELVHNSQPDKYLKLLGHCLHNRLELYPESKFGLIYLTREDYRNYDIQRGDTEGIINYLMMLKSVHVGALVTNQPSIIKLSLRSKGDFSVQRICKEHFNGGGQRNASGGSSKQTLEETINKLKEVVPKYMFVNQ